VYFDDEEDSGTYAESVRRCPNCTALLDSNALEIHGIVRRR
jgi:hypothetical protein